MAIREKIKIKLNRFEEKLEISMKNISDMLTQLISYQLPLTQTLQTNKKEYLELLQKIQEVILKLEELLNKSNNSGVVIEGSTSIIIPEKVKLLRI